MDTAGLSCINCLELTVRITNLLLPIDYKESLVSMYIFYFT